MAETGTDRTGRPADWNASPRPDSSDAGDEAPAEPGSHFEGDFGAEELPRKAAGRERDLESTDRPGER